MPQDSRLPSEPLSPAPRGRATHEPALPPATPGPRPRRGESGEAKTGTLTSRLMDYRDWWNLPRRPRKHPF